MILPIILPRQQIELLICLFYELPYANNDLNQLDCLAAAFT